MPGVTRGTGRTWTCSVAWRDPISEAKLRLTGTRRLVPSPSPCSGTFLKFLLYPCLRSSVICAPSLLLPDTPTPCQSLPGAFLSGQPPAHTSHSGEGTRWNECPSPGPSAGHLEGSGGLTPGAHGGHSPGMSSQLPLSLHLSLPASSLLLLELTSQINYLHPCPHLRLCSRGDPGRGHPACLGCGARP